jgi:hypothetical protein
MASGVAAKNHGGFHRGVIKSPDWEGREWEVKSLVMLGVHGVFCVRTMTATVLIACNNNGVGSEVFSYVRSTWSVLLDSPNSM